MRNSIGMAAVFCLASGMAFAQGAGQAPQQTNPANPPAATQQTPAPNAAATAATEAQAKAKFEAEGYSNVTELKKDANGKWTARAMKSGKTSQVSLDNNGRVTEAN